MYHLPDLRPIFALAIIGLVASAVAVIGGVAWLLWFVIAHVRVV